MINTTKKNKNRYWGYVYDDNDKKVLKELHEFEPSYLFLKADPSNHILIQYIDDRFNVDGSSSIVMNVKRQSLYLPSFKYYSEYEMQNKYPEYLI